MGRRADIKMNITHSINVTHGLDGQHHFASSRVNDTAASSSSSSTHSITSHSSSNNSSTAVTKRDPAAFPDDGLHGHNTSSTVLRNRTRHRNATSAAAKTRMTSAASLTLLPALALLTLLL
jgi:hypothetical protein